MLLRRGSASTSTTLWAGSGPGGSTLGVAPLRLRYSRSTRRRSAPRVSPRRAPAGGISGRVSARAGFPFITAVTAAEVGWRVVGHLSSRRARVQKLVLLRPGRITGNVHIAEQSYDCLRDLLGELCGNRVADLAILSALAASEVHATLPE